jgi:hypothetical protein
MATFGPEWKEGWNTITPYFFIKFEDNKLKIKNETDLAGLKFGFKDAKGNFEIIPGIVVKTGIDRKGTFQIIFTRFNDDINKIQFNIRNNPNKEGFIIFEGISVWQGNNFDLSMTSFSPEVIINLSKSNGIQQGVPINKNGEPIESKSNLFACSSGCTDPKPKSSRWWPFGGKKHKKHSRKNKKHSKKHKKGKKHTRKHK